jgi:hypothetical protein
MQWTGRRWMVRAWGQALPLNIANPAVRQAIKAQFAFPLDVIQQMGYGLFAGRKETSQCVPLACSCCCSMPSAI